MVTLFPFSIPSDCNYFECLPDFLSIFLQLFLIIQKQSSTFILYFVLFSFSHCLWIFPLSQGESVVFFVVVLMQKKIEKENGKWDRKRRRWMKVEEKEKTNQVIAKIFFFEKVNFFFTWWGLNKPNHFERTRTQRKLASHCKWNKLAGLQFFG